ncbi:MAG: methyltransferase domain-containing protein [Rhodovibrionaceae bacterium]
MVDLADLKAHYTRGGLAEKIFAALRAAGKDPEKLTLDDLAPIDEFHSRGREATLELAGFARLMPETRVLDLGCGLGGPARRLAKIFACRVTGLDLTPEYVEVANLLAECCGLKSRIAFIQGNALDTPFEDASFDVVWSQHAAMNIADKAKLYAEAARLLKPGGRLALYDILAGEGGAPHFPLPWARDPAHSHLIAPEALRETLSAAGFEVQHWRERSADGLAWFTAAEEHFAAKGLPPLGLHLLLGEEDFLAMIENLRRNFAEGRVRLFEAIAAKR